MAGFQLLAGRVISALGITIVFDDYQKVGFIFCEKKVIIKGLRAGMNFKQIQKKLGRSEIYEIYDEESDSIIYELRYNIGGCNLLFMSDQKDGSDSSFTIYRIGATYFAPFPTPTQTPTN